MVRKAVMVKSDGLSTAAAALAAVEYYKRQQKWVKEQMEKDSLNVANAGIMKPIIAKDVASKQKEHLSPLFLESCCTFVGTEKSWGQTIFENQFFICRQGFSEIAISPWGVGDCKWVLAGMMVIFGLAYAACPGSNFSQKVNFVTGLRQADLERLLKEEPSCFLLQASMGELVAIPPASLVLTHVPNEDCEGVRWGFMPAKQNAIMRAARDVCQALFAHTTEVSGEGPKEMDEWIKYIGRDLLQD